MHIYAYYYNKFNCNTYFQTILFLKIRLTIFNITYFIFFYNFLLIKFEFLKFHLLYFFSISKI